MTCVAHHWLLESSGITNVPARCKRCNATKTFNASGIPVDDWTGTTSAWVLADPKRTAASRARGAAAQKKAHMKRATK